MKVLSSFYQTAAGSGAVNPDLITPPASIQGVRVPNTTVLPTFANDGSYIKLPGQGQSLAVANTKYSKYDKNGNIVWAVSPDQINSNHVIFTGFQWYDMVDQALWLLTADANYNITETTLAKIDDATGAIIVVGTAAVSLPGSNVSTYRNRLMYWAERAAHGSGDFYFKNQTKECTISSVNGSILSGPTDITQDGVKVDNYTHYRSADGKVLVRGPHLTVSTDTANSSGPYRIEIIRGGGMGSAFMNNALSAFGAKTSESAVIRSGGWLVVWKDFVALSAGGPVSPTSSTDTYDALGPRFFDRTTSTVG